MRSDLKPAPTPDPRPERKPRRGPRLGPTPILRIGPRISLPLTRRLLLWLPLLVALGLALLWLALGSGSGGTTDRIALLLGPRTPETQLLAELRLPRIFAALIAGAMLAVSGHLLQIVSRNGLADPGLLGLSQGAVLAILIGGALFRLAPAQLVWLGVAGALTTALTVLALSRGLGASGLILLGLATNAVLGAGTEIIATSAGIDSFARLAIWSAGDLTGTSRSDLALLALWAAALTPALIALGPRLGPLALGADAARALGVGTRWLTPALVALAAALAAPVVAVAGPIAFLGLMAPWLARRLVGDGAEAVLWTSAVVGGVLLLGADTAGRAAFAPVVIPAGLMIAFAGVAAFLAILILDRRR